MVVARITWTTRRNDHAPIFILIGAEAPGRGMLPKESCMRNSRVQWMSIILFIVGGLGIGLLFHGVLGAAKSATHAPHLAPVLATAPLRGTFRGQVALQGVVTGVYSDSLTLPAANSQPTLGNIDLALTLTQTGNQLHGYVALDNTLIFTVEHMLAGQTALAIGPYVNGQIAGTTLTLRSEQVRVTINGQSLTRQFRLIGQVDETGKTLTGEYRETIWDYARQPLTTIGAFTLQQPGGAGLTPSSTPTPIPPPSPTTGRQTIYLPIIAR